MPSMLHEDRDGLLRRTSHSAGWIPRSSFKMGISAAPSSTPAGQARGNQSSMLIERLADGSANSGTRTLVVLPGRTSPHPH